LIHIFFPWKKEPKNSAICVIYNKLSYSRGKNSPNLATLNASHFISPLVTLEPRRLCSSIYIYECYFLYRC
jgi:hypothetical protein